MDDYLTRLKEEKKKGVLNILDVNRKGRNRVSPVLMALREKPYTVEDLVKKTGKGKQSVLNAVNKFEKKVKNVVAFELSGQIVYFEKECAKKEGLI